MIYKNTKLVKLIQIAEIGAAQTSLGRLGGKARSKKLTVAQRVEIAEKAAEARWSRRKGGEPRDSSKLR